MNARILLSTPSRNTISFITKVTEVAMTLNNLGGSRKLKLFPNHVIAISHVIYMKSHIIYRSSHVKYLKLIRSTG